MERRTDKKIAEWFREEADRISIPADMKTEIDRRISDAERSGYMMKNRKRFNAKRVVLAVAAVALIGSVTAVAAGRLAASSSHSSMLDQVNNYSALAEVKEEVGFDFPSVEEFSNGFVFDFAVPVDSSDYDEDGNVLSDYKKVSLAYTDGAQQVWAYISQVRPYEEGTTGGLGSTPVWQGEKDGISLTVTKTVHKFVPPDYEKTQEDIQAEQEGSLVFAYGSSEVEINVSYSCIFEKDGLSYDLLGFDLTMEPEELAQMAAELVAAGK